MSDIIIERNLDYITSEIKALITEFTDPLVQNFKILIDYDRPTGLFASENNIDSALAYLKRIGETERYEMHKKWIELFKNFVKDYDFLILNCTGLDVIANKKPGEFFTEDDKIIFTIRETIDMRFQSLLTTYRHVWFDDIRMVEVLPSNLRKFDIFILVYSSGYFNSFLYDIDETRNPQDSILPTIKKLTDKNLNEKTIDNLKFNSHLFKLKSASINDESGKDFFETISNELSGDFIKNNFVLNFKFANFSGNFNNIFGAFNFVDMLAKASTQNKLMQYSSLATPDKDSYFKQMKNSFVNAGKDLSNNIKSKVKNFPKRFTNPNTFIGSAIEQISNPNFLATMSKNGVDLLLSRGDDYLNGKISNLHSLLSQNFSDTFNSTYDSSKNNVKTIEYSPKINPVIENSSTMKNPTLFENNDKISEMKVSNIYNRNNF